VNVHKNARLAPGGRAQMVRRVLQGESVAAVARAMSSTPKTVKKWVGRWREAGLVGLQDRSSRPRRSPNKLGRGRERQIMRLRLKRWSGPRIAEELKLPLSTVGAVCRRQGLGRLRNLDPRPPIRRYEWARPGEMVHLDTKKLARIEKVGHRIHGDRARSVEGAGWELLHVCVDDATRLAYAEVLPDEKGDTCSAFLHRARTWFGARGVAFQRVMTDNGCGYLSKAFRQLIQEIGAKHVRTRPYTPRTNGKAERFIQTCKRDWAYARPYQHSEVRTAALAAFLCFYNCYRPHWGIGRKSPQLRLRELGDNVPGCNN
jgi:transposase InsO family protein